MITFDSLDTNRQAKAFNYCIGNILEQIISGDKKLEDFSDDPVIEENSTWITNKIKNFYRLAGETKEPEKNFFSTLQQDREIQNIFFPLVRAIVGGCCFLEEDEAFVPNGKTPVRLKGNEIPVYKEQARLVLEEEGKVYIHLRDLG